MIFKNIELIESSDIQVLVDNEVPEGKQLDYKKKLPANSDGDKKEFLADIVSFANTSGGDIIYGVSETANDTNSDIEIAYQVSGLGAINFDDEILRLDNILRDGISPRIVGIQIRGIKTNEADPKVIIIRIPKSWNSPHMVIYKSKSRFHARNNAGKYHMDN
ncbi:ATP-binding protein [Leptothoe sp. LEGE 181152]|nr:ATP-binding protein [Leptothoe sp. LEGE 181152]